MGNRIMKRTLVLGASIKPERYSYKAVVALVNHGHEVIPVGLRYGKIAGVEIKKGTPKVSHIDTISLYLSARNQVGYYDYILKCMPKRVIFNPGTENQELQKLLDQRKIGYDQACTLVLLSTGQY